MVPECPISYSGPGRVVGLVWFLLLLELPAREMPEKSYALDLEPVAVRTFFQGFVWFLLILERPVQRNLLT